MVTVSNSSNLNALNCDCILESTNSVFAISDPSSSIHPPGQPPPPPPAPAPRPAEQQTTTTAHAAAILLAPLPPDHEISSRGGDLLGTPSTRPREQLTWWRFSWHPLHQTTKSAHVVAILLAPPPAQRYSTGVVTEGVSEEWRYDVPSRVGLS